MKPIRIPSEKISINRRLEQQNVLRILNAIACWALWVYGIPDTVLEFVEVLCDIRCRISVLYDIRCRYGICGLDWCTFKLVSLEGYLNRHVGGTGKCYSLG